MKTKILLIILILILLGGVTGVFLFQRFLSSPRSSTSDVFEEIPENTTKVTVGQEISKESPVKQKENKFSLSTTTSIAKENTDVPKGNTEEKKYAPISISTTSKPEVHHRMDITFYKGVWTQPGGEIAALENDIAKMKEDGINIFPVSVLYHTENDGSVRIVSISPEWEMNPTQGYVTLIRKAHNGGLGVFLELDFEHWWEDRQFSHLSEEIKKKFLIESQKACSLWAAIGEQEQVELFSPMNEPTNTLGVQEGIKWMADVLPIIKRNFTGKTNVKLYGIELGDFSDNGSIIGYAYVSVNVYTIGTSAEEFLKYIKEMVLPYMNECVEKYNLKGYLFGEMGVPVTEAEQAQIFQQFFESTWNDDNNKGYFLSGWGPKVALDDPFPDTRFTGRPAEDVIKKWYNER